jgi:hypothetical protein
VTACRPPPTLRTGTLLEVSTGADDLELDPPLTEDELTELALAADPAAPIPVDAVPIGVHLAHFAPAPLPLWYMPPVLRSGHRRWRTPVVLAVVSAFLLIDALGLCNTYGILSWA